MTTAPSPSDPPSRATGSWEYNIDRDQITCDPRWYQLIGLDPVRDAVRRVEDFRAWIHPEDIETATAIDLDDIDRLLAQDQPYHRDYRIVRPDGQVRWLRSVACLIRENGERKAIGCVTDVTDYLAGRGDAGLASSASKPKTPSPLSRRERDCLTWVAHGKTAWETAVILELSPRTVEFHLANASRKLNAANKVQAATIAIRRGLL